MGKDAFWECPCGGPKRWDGTIVFDRRYTDSRAPDKWCLECHDGGRGAPKFAVYVPAPVRKAIMLWAEGLTQDQAAERCGTTRRTLYKYVQKIRDCGKVGSQYSRSRVLRG